MAQSNVSRLIIGKALGHRSTEATQIYARLRTDAARDGKALATAKFRSCRGSHSIRETFC
jgi:hypothetical protein